MKKKFYIATLGCKVNQYESEAIGHQLHQAGYCYSEKDADLCIINTCSVTASASRSSKNLLRSLLRKHPRAQMVVTGCDYQNMPSAYEKNVRVKAISNEKKEQLVEIITTQRFPFLIENFPKHTRAFVKIQDGCNDFCSYCIVPHLRGRSRSRALEEIVYEISLLVQRGYKEVVLTGINLGKYQDHKENRLSDLLYALEQVAGLEQIRLSSINPEDIHQDLIKALQQSQKICPSFHVVLQSGSNAILKRMRRRYTREIFLEKVASLQSVFPDSTFTTDVIVGFPGETEQDFEKTLDIIQKIGLIKVHIFPFSPREKTLAYHYEHALSKEVIAARKKILEKVVQESAARKKQNFIDKMTSVLIEGKNKEGLLWGHTPHFFEVALLQKQEIAQNSIVPIYLKKTTPWGFRGEVVCT